MPSNLSLNAREDLPATPSPSPANSSSFWASDTSHPFSICSQAREKFEADRKAAEAAVGVWTWDEGANYYYNEVHRWALQFCGGPWAVLRQWALPCPWTDGLFQPGSTIRTCKCRALI